jgi:thiol-disulfide isomerase/thioredoxin
MKMRNLKSVHVVFAKWCPHCIPTTVEPVREKAQKLGVPCVLYDIDDPIASRKGDDLVKRYGDWSPDYLVPQVFVEYDNGKIRHVFTGYSEDVELTRRGVGNLLSSHIFKRSGN